MKTPICPILLFYEGDEFKCNTDKCNYNRFKKTCTMKCLKFQENHEFNKSNKNHGFKKRK